MIRKKNDNTQPQKSLETTLTEILITNNGALKPYLHTFRFEPKNIALQSLGSVFGIFEIEDHSEDSAYIVNFLASVAKKEYFAHPKRTAIESLEATLHKINIALSELIKQDNTAWLGKFNAALCVLEKNNLHFSVSGGAKTLLVRKGLLSDISEGLAEESELHPLKTFTEVSSGRLLLEDKIILTTPGLFDIFSPQELQKNAERFTNEKFSQFLKTALVNQLLFGSTLIIDLTESTTKKPSIHTTATLEEAVAEIPNAFSQSSFTHTKKTSAKKSHETAGISKETVLAEATIVSASAPDTTHYTDAKTGHIYVQGEGTPEATENETWVKIQWLLEDTGTTLKQYSIKFFHKSWRFLQNITQLLVEYTVIGWHQGKSTLKKASSKTTRAWQKYQTQQTFKNSSALPLSHQSAYEQGAFTVDPSTTASSTILFSKPASLPAFSIPLSNTSRNNILPRFRVLKDRFRTLNAKQKKFALVAILSIFVVPFFLISTLQKETMPVPVSVQEIPSPAPLSLVHDKNLHRVASEQTLLVNSSLLTTILLKQSLFAVTKTAIISLDDTAKTQSFSLPSQFGTSILKATSMNDLNTIFLFTDTGMLVSFTPSNHAFTANQITLPANVHITSLATYLTYLYVLDSHNNTLYRYPRADGGFGNMTTWLKESLDISDTSSIAINESVYLTQNNSFLSFNRGKKEFVSFETSATPIIPSSAFAREDTRLVYILDIANTRLIAFDKSSGSILNQYTNNKLKEAISVVVDEASNKAIFTTPTEVFSLSLDK
jgi:hypothetical protein